MPKSKPSSKPSGEARAPESSVPPAEAGGSTPGPTPAKRAPRGAPKAVAAGASDLPSLSTPTTAPVASTHVVDASGLVLGRAASLIAKRLLQGETVVVVNAEKSVVTGSRTSVLAFYTANRARGSKRTGPHYPRYPDRIFRRTVRGMLPHQKTRGKQAYDRLVVHIGVPPEWQAHAQESLESARAHPTLNEPMTLAEISRLLGARL